MRLDENEACFHGYPLFCQEMKVLLERQARTAFQDRRVGRAHPARVGPEALGRLEQRDIRAFLGTLGE